MSRSDEILVQSVGQGTGIDLRRANSFTALIAIALVLLAACDDDPVARPDADDPVDIAPDQVDADLFDLFDGDDDTPDLVDLDVTELDEPDMLDMFDSGIGDGGVLVELDPGAVEEDEGLFPLGIQAGAMRPSSVLLWTYASDQAAKTLLVWRPSFEAGHVYLVFDEPMEPSADGYFHVPVEGLAPGTVYNYAFFNETEDGALESRSFIGRVRTALAPGSLEPLTVGAFSCTHHRYAPWDALVLLAAEDVDVFLHLGDMSYNDDATTLEEYRAIWHETLSDRGYHELYSSTGLYATWDDHEIADNFDPETINPDQLQAGIDAFYETVAVERGPDDRLWGSYLWGDTAEFLVLDSRTERLPSTRTSDDAIYISREQMDWLKDRLLNSPTHFKVVLNSVGITNMPLVWDLGEADRWEGYDAQRDELLDFIVDNDIRNVWFISGDFHLGYVAHVEPNGPRWRIYEISAGPGGNGPNPLILTLADRPQFPYSTPDIEAYTTFTFDPVADNVHIRFVNHLNEVLVDDVFSDSDE